MFPVALRPGDTVTVMGVVTAEWDPLPPFHIAPQGDITIKYRLQGTSRWVSATTTTTDDSGLFTASFDAPSDPGVYDLRAVFDGEKWVGRWCLWSFEWKDSRVTVVGAFVIPEYTMAALGAMLSSFGAFVVYKYRDRFHR
jgi:hypothetical protein